MIQRFSFFTILWLLFCGIAQAHTGLMESIPPRGAILDQSPSELVLFFGDPAVLMDVKLTRKGKKGKEFMELDFTASDTAAQKHVIALPKLASGRYKVRWKALGADQHHTRGRISFEIR